MVHGVWIGVKLAQKPASDWLSISEILENVWCVVCGVWFPCFHDESNLPLVMTTKSNKKNKSKLCMLRRTDREGDGRYEVLCLLA